MKEPTSTIKSSHLPCPKCPSTDAYCLYDDGHGYCFSCKTLTKGDQVIDNGSSINTEYTYEFLGRRGIAAETFRHFASPTKIDRDGKPVSVGFRYPNGSVKVRLLDKKEFFWSGKPEPGLFGRDKFAPGSNKTVTITEGEYDAISLFQVLRSPVVSVQSSASALRDVTVDRSWLNSFERIYLAFDDDAPGRDAAREVARLFDYNKLRLVRFGDKKDANAFLQEGLDADLRTLWTNAGRYMPENIMSSLEDFEKLIREEPERGVPYPRCLRRLNEMTYGIHKGQLTLLTAQEGVGKTEIMKTLEHQLLKETDNAIAAIYLEEPNKFHVESLAGIELRKPCQLPDSGCTRDEIVKAFQNLVKTDNRLYLYRHFGSDDPDVLLDTIRFLVTACSCDFVLLDHLTMAVSGLSGEDERRALDYLSTRLAMMVQELNYALVVVSHVNDEGKTRGSRYVGKVAHTRIDLSRPFLDPDPIRANTTDVMLSKNRLGKKTGPAGSIYFDTSTNTYSEIEPCLISA